MFFGVMSKLILSFVITGINRENEKEKSLIYFGKIKISTRLLTIFSLFGGHINDTIIYSTNFLSSYPYSK